MTEEQRDLSTRHCQTCAAGVPPLTEEEVELRLARLSGWECSRGELTKRFEFKNYHQTMAFVNAVAWIAHSEGHHPDLEVSYRFCLVRYTTHAIGGLSDNDFICAARVDGLFA